MTTDGKPYHLAALHTAHTALRSVADPWSGAPEPIRNTAADIANHVHTLIKRAQRHKEPTP